MKKQLALVGGEPLFDHNATPYSVFQWPIITEEDEQACLNVIRTNAFSGTNITTEFQNQFAEWQARQYAIAFTNGTMSLSAAMFAIGLGAGDEIICPTKTYWGSVSQAINFGATAVFANIDDNLSIDPDDIERCITPRTKALMIVHYFGYPCDMDRIMPIVKKHNLKLIEDVSHAHGSLYKGRKVGTFGDIAAMSMMSGKGFAAGELGMLVTDDRELYERAMAYGHYERNNDQFITDPELLRYSHIALGGVKGRANQISTTLAIGQLKYFDERCAEINKAMTYFCEGIKGIRGVRPIAADQSVGSTNGAWYCPQAAYYPDELGGLSSGRYAEAIRCETNGFYCWEGANFCLHTHPFFKDFDFYHLGKPSRIAFSDRDARPSDDACKPSESKYCVTLPRFTKFEPEIIDKYIEAYRTVSENYEQLIEKDNNLNGGRWYGTTNA